jgi:hypothetical protein
MSTLKANAIQTLTGKPILNSTGSILQVVQTVKSDVFSTTSTSMTDVTGLSASITPSNTNNKILINYSVYMASSSQNYLSAGDITRNGTIIFVGDAVGNRLRATFGTQDSAAIHGATYCHSGMFLDTPSSTSLLTYQIRVRAESPSTTWINRGNEADGDASITQRLISSITLMEVSG